MKKVTPTTILMISVTVFAFFPSSFADDTNEVISPNECQPYSEIPSTVHYLNILTPAPVVSGTHVTLEAGVTDIGSHANRVRFLWYDSSGSLVQETIIERGFQPLDSWSVADTFYGVDHGSWEVVACFETANNTVEMGITRHIDVTSFFVTSESAIGGIASISALFTVLGGYIFMKVHRAPRL